MTSLTSAPAVNALLDLRGLGLRFGADGPESKWIIRDLDLSVTSGEFVTVMGTSGAGKSTLLNLVAQTLVPSAGEIVLDGQVVGGAGRTPQPGCGRRIGYVTQDDNLLPWRTVLENVLFAMTIVAKPTRELKDRAGALLAQVGLGDWMNHYPHQLSGGMRKRAALARTLVYDPPVILMDEPFGALDAETRARLQEDLLGLWERNRKTILFVTHDVHEAIALGSRVVVLSGSPSRITLERSIDIPRPRDPEAVFKDSSYAGHYDAIRQRLRSGSA